MKIKFRVDYLESERGWGTDEWFVDFDTSEQAHAAVADCNKDNPTSYVPDYYIVASYRGPVELEDDK